MQYVITAWYAVSQTSIVGQKQNPKYPEF